MVTLEISDESFKLFKKFPVIPRIIIAAVFVVGGLVIQIVLPISGIFPFESQEISYVAFGLGLAFIVMGIILLFPERLVVSEEPKLGDSKAIWVDSDMRFLSDYFNLINTRKKKEKLRSAFFDLTKPRGRWIFISTILGVTLIYILVLVLGNRNFPSTFVFLLDIYALIIPIWFVIRIKSWEPDILRKVLFYYQFSKHEELDDYEFTTTPALQLQQIKEKKVKEELMLPVNVRFMVDFDNPPDSFDSLSIQILINESMGNKFPAFVCFLRMRKPSDWKPLKKEIAYADTIIKIQHMVEEADLHLFVLSKSQKVENPNHTSPKEATKIFKRAYKMMRDFA
ncbi:MAG: hypothetical protein FK732_10330 [Asgard group archaeon]|nr:hypothetical protein [Asgard group archaeon]